MKENRASTSAERKLRKRSTVRDQVYQIGVVDVSEESVENKI